ncbi:cytochrome P450 [Tuber brumale]|nr:cytochrome P450 [Tuber brumale]
MALDVVIAYVRELAPSLSRGTIAATVLGVWLLNRIGLVFYRLYLDPLSKFPGPKLAAATSLYEMYYDIVQDGSFTWKMKELHEKYGPIVRVSPYSLRLRKSSAYHEVHRMGTPFSKDIRFYRQFFIYDAIFSIMDNELHRQRRSLLNPVFSRKAILNSEPVIKEKLDLLCRRMKEHEAQDKLFNCHKAFAAFIVDIITEFAYSKSYDILSLPDFDSRIEHALDSQLEAILIFKHFPILAEIVSWLPIWIINSLMPDGGSFAELELDAKVHLMEVFARVSDGTIKNNPAHRSIFGGMLAENPDLKSTGPTKLAQEAMSIVAAGVHITRWTMCVGLLEVARDPLIQAKLYEELKMASPDINGEFSYLRCEKLPYLRGVILEMLRLSYGIPSTLPRRVPKEGAIVGGYHLPGDSTIEIDCYSIHHDEDIFPDSHRFWPERWLTPESKQNEKFVVSFGAGPRQCIGINLAMCELYMSIATIFRRFEIDISARGTERMKFTEHWSVILRDEPLKCKVISRKE